MREYRIIRQTAPASRPWATEIDPWWEPGPQLSITVYEDDSPRHTGLLDQYGDPIVSRVVINPIGFNR
jgi:hypothetical protein